MTASVQENKSKHTGGMPQIRTFCFSCRCVHFEPISIMCFDLLLLLLLLLLLVVIVVVLVLVVLLLLLLLLLFFIL